MRKLVTKIWKIKYIKAGSNFENIILYAFRTDAFSYFKKPITMTIYTGSSCTKEMGILKEDIDIKYLDTKPVDYETAIKIINKYNDYWNVMNIREKAYMINIISVNQVYNVKN